MSRSEKSDFTPMRKFVAGRLPDSAKVKFVGKLPTGRVGILLTGELPPVHKRSLLAAFARQFGCDPVIAFDRKVPA